MRKKKEECKLSASNLIGKPKKSNNYVVYVVCLIFVLYIALHSAICWESVLNMISSGQIKESDKLLTCIKLVTERIESDSMNFQWNAYTIKFLFWGFLGWFVVCAAIENSRRNYISGKEFGTAQWANKNEIVDLFADTIKSKDIKDAKKMKYPFQRRRIRSKRMKECRIYSKRQMERMVHSLEEREAELKLPKEELKKYHKEELEKINEKVKEEEALARKQAWKPDLLKEEYQKNLKEIEKKTGEDNLYSKEEAKKKKEDLTKEYKYSLVEFYDIKKRIAEIEKKYKNADILFTQTERISFYNYVLNQNTLIFGGSGSGKSRGYVLPNLLQAFGCYVVTDPKGEVLEKSGKFLEDEGYKIRVLNLDNKAESDYYNPFKYIHPDRVGYEERVLSLIETIIRNTDGGEKQKSNDPFWEKGEQLFLQSIFFFTVDCFEEKDRNINTANQLIKMLEIEEDRDDKDSKLDLFVQEKVIPIYGEDHIGVEMFNEFRSKASGKTAKSIVISAVARLAPFKTPAIRRIISDDTIELERMGEEKIALFVVVPPTDKTYNFIAGMLFTQLFQELQYCATQVHKHEGQRLPIPVRFILDEFANTCNIPNFVQILAYARSFGIGISIILQSLEQIKSMYKDDWGVIVDNCNTLLYLGGISHDATLEYVVKMIGKGTFDKKTTGQTRGRQGSSSRNWDVVGRELMDVAELKKIPETDCLFFVGGRNPFYSQKYNYANHPNYCYTSDANQTFTYQHNPKEPSALIEEKEQMERTHREDEAKEYVKQLMQEVELIELIDSPEKMMNRIGRGDLGLIPDEEFTLNDGEKDTIEEDVVATMEEAIEEVAESTSDSIQPQLVQDTQFIETVENISEQGQRIVQAMENGGMEEISDNEFMVSDGENEQQEVDENIMEMLEDGDMEDIFDEDVDIGQVIETVKASGLLEDDMEDIQSPIDN